jgi:hypothetical protein
MSSFLHRILNTKHSILTVLFLLAFTERVFIDLGPNIELITMTMILVSYYYGRKEAFWITLALIAFSDRMIGNSPIFLFTWSGFLIPAIFIKPILNKLHKTKHTRLRNYTLALTLALTSNLFFYVWTNLGVWYLDSFNMYPDTINGLTLSYINGLPFLRLHLTSTMLFIPIGFLIIETVKSFSKKHTIINSVKV